MTAFADKITAAAEYARRGFLVLPLYGVHDRGDKVYVCNCSRGADCRSPGKHPPIKHEYATRDPQLAARRQELIKKWGLCAIIDEYIRVAVFDFDGAEGRKTRSQIESTHGPLPETWTQITGRSAGGEHLFYRVPANLNYYAIRNRKIAPGLDVKGESGLVVLAPTQHRSGNYYSWKNDHPITELPNWLYQLAVSVQVRQREFSSNGARPTEDTLPPLPKRLARARSALVEMPPAIQGNDGSTTCLRAAIMLIRGFCLPTEVAFDLLWDVYNPVCVPPWNETELLHKIESAEFNVDIPWRYRLDGIPDDEYWTNMKASVIGRAVSQPAPVPTARTAELVAPMPSSSPSPVVGGRRAPRMPRSLAEVLWSVEPPVSTRFVTAQVEYDAAADFDEIE